MTSAHAIIDSKLSLQPLLYGSAVMMCSQECVCARLRASDKTKQALCTIDSPTFAAFRKVQFFVFNASTWALIQTFTNKATQKDPDWQN